MICNWFGAGEKVSRKAGVKFLIFSSISSEKRDRVTFVIWKLIIIFSNHRLTKLDLTIKKTSFGGFFQRLFDNINFQKNKTIVQKIKNYYHVLFGVHFLKTHFFDHA